MTPQFSIDGSIFPPGLSLVEASAGTGKTFALSHLVARFLLDGTAASVGSILLVTFTNDAAREIAERTRRVLETLAEPPSADEASNHPGIAALREKFGDDACRRVARRALLDIDRLCVSTIHSFCQQTLQLEGALCGLPSMPELIPDAHELTARAIRDLWEKAAREDAFFAKLASRNGWDWNADLHFARTALALDDFVPVPGVGTFSDVRKEFEKLAGLLAIQVRNDLPKIFQKVEDRYWNKGYKEIETREKMLGAACDPDNPSWFGGIKWIAELTKGIRANSPVGKVAGEIEAVKMAKDLLTLCGKARWAWENECARHVREVVPAALRANRQITYDGLITSLRDALRGPSGAKLAARLRERFSVALVDEAQDTDARQFEIFQSIFLDGTRRLVLIGDPKQAIYGFRGADLETYLQARAAAGACFSLQKTYRAPQPLVNATNAIFSRPNAFLDSRLVFEPAVSGLVDAPRLWMGDTPDPVSLQFWLAPDEEAEDFSSNEKRQPALCRAVAGEISRLLNQPARLGPEKDDAKPVCPGDFAVLVRDRYQADAITEALREARIPAILSGAKDIMATEEAREMLAILAALDEPRKNTLRRAALATRICGFDIEAIRADESSLDQFVAWRAMWESAGLAAALTAIDRAFDASPRLAALPDGERRVTNLRQLAELAEAASIANDGDPAATRKWLADAIASATDGEPPEERQTRLESDSAAVQIVTMHKAKGLEYPFVFYPFLWGARGLKTDGFQKLAGNPPRMADLSLADATTQTDILRAELEESLRLAYVAITRAKVKVWICAGAIGGSRTPASALDWLLRPTTVKDFSKAWCDAVPKQLRGAIHQAAIDEIISACEGSAACAPLPCGQPQPYAHRDTGGTTLVPPPSAPAIPPPWGLTSFSGLTREKNPHAPAAENPPPESAPGREPAPDPAPANPFLKAPGGALVGTAIHEWIEGWDFGVPDPDAVAAHLGRHRFADPGFATSVVGMLGELREAALPGVGLPLAQACADPAASEWHFQLPVAGRLTAGAIAHVFRSHGHSAYADLVADLPADQLGGYLHGFIDRLADCHGTWGIIDWKTNNLGPSPADYSPESLLACAMESHYFLQAHLYLVALRRFLGSATAGAWLVFLRGVRTGTSDGILAIQPTGPLLRDLEALFTSPTP